MHQPVIMHVEKDSPLAGLYLNRAEPLPLFERKVLFPRSVVERPHEIMLRVLLRTVLELQ